MTVTKLFTLLLTIVGLISCEKDPPVLSERNLFLPDKAPANIMQLSSDISKKFVLRERTARLNESYFFNKALEPATAEPVIFNIFEDRNFQALATDLEVLSNGIQLWRGNTDDDEVTRLALAIQGNRLTGEVRLGSYSYRIMPLEESGWYRIIEVDPTLLPPEGPYLEIDREEKISEIDKLSRDCDSPLPFPIPPGKGNRIAIHVAFTSDAALASPNIHADIALLMDQLKGAWQSPYFAVHPIFAKSTEVAYRDSGNMFDDLNRLTRSDDGIMDELHSIRDKNKADLVVLLVERADYCGMAWRPSLPLQSNDSVRGFSVVQRECGLNNLSFAHEIGHNLGMRHDRYVEETLSGRYEFGYINHKLRYRTIMAYNKDCSDKGYNCKRLPYYSSPHIRYKGELIGQPIGSSHAAHNMNILCASSGTVTNYR